MNVIGYIRVSTQQQDTEKNKTAIIDFAQRYGFENVSFVTEKVSGAKSWRQRKLSDVVYSLHQSDVLIVPEFSRLGRSLVEVLEVLNILTEQGVRVFSVKENFQINASDMMAKMMRTMLGLFAEIERDIIIQRTKEGIAAARKNGKVLGNPVLRNQDNPKYKQLKNRQQEGIQRAAQNNERNQRAKQFISELLPINYSYRQIAQKLNEHGFVTARGKQFTSVQVSRLVHNKQLKENNYR